MKVLTVQTGPVEKKTEMKPRSGREAGLPKEQHQGRDPKVEEGPIPNFLGLYNLTNMKLLADLGKQRVKVQILLYLE